jgi:hypothetical protein
MLTVRLCRAKVVNTRQVITYTLTRLSFLVKVDFCSEEANTEIKRLGLLVILWAV